MLINELAPELRALPERRAQKSRSCRRPKPRADNVEKNKSNSHVNCLKTAARGNANYVREESENGGEQEAAIPLTGGFVRSVMV